MGLGVGLLLQEFVGGFQQGVLILQQPFDYPEHLRGRRQGGGLILASPVPVEVTDMGRESLLELNKRRFGRELECPLGASSLVALLEDPPAHCRTESSIRKCEPRPISRYAIRRQA